MSNSCYLKLFILVKRSTCFGRSFCPSSGAQTAYTATIYIKQLLSQIIYSCKTFYMFRTVFLSIIRSSKLRIQQRYISNSCYLKLFILVKRSTCFGLSFRPSSGAQTAYTTTLYVKQLLLPAAIAPGSSSCLTYTVAVYAVWAPDDGRKDRPKHVERFTRINNLR